MKDDLAANSDMLDRLVLLEAVAGPVDVGSACLRVERDHGMSRPDTTQSVDRLVRDGWLRRYDEERGRVIWDMIALTGRSAP